MFNKLIIKNRKNKSLNSQILLIIFFLAMIIFLSIKSPFFFTWNNWRNILDHTALQIILALGMTFVIASGGIDLSVGAIAGLSGIFMAISMKSGVSVNLSIFIGIIGAIFLGFSNGYIISKFNINPFIITLGTMWIYRGLSLIITNGQPIYGFFKSFNVFGKGSFGPITVPILMAIIASILCFIILKRTKWGQYSLAIGGNESALLRSGVNVKRYKISIYIFSAIAGSIAGLILTSRLSTAEPNAGIMLELEAIAAVALGGSRMKGGQASILGTIIGSLLLGVLRNGLTILSIPSYYQQFIMGIIVVMAVIVSEIQGGEIVNE